jgi:transcriptional regulator with XRE-family HTH domain
MRRKSKPKSSSTKQLISRSAGVADIEMGQRIRQRRREIGISQTELAGKLGLSFQQMQKYEKGSNRVGASRLQQIAEMLGVDMPFFYDVTASNQTSTACSSSTAFSASGCSAPTPPSKIKRCRDGRTDANQHYRHNRAYVRQVDSPRRQLGNEVPPHLISATVGPLTSGSPSCLHLIISNGNCARNSTGRKNAVPKISWSIPANSIVPWRLSGAERAATNLL